MNQTTADQMVADLNALIRELGLTQKDVGAVMGVSQSQASKILREMRPITLKQFVTLRDYLNCLAAFKAEQ